MNRQSREVMVDRARITPPLILRSIRPGDRFQPLGMTGSKKVGDYLIDRKVPKVLRDEIVLLCDNDGIIWLVGYEIADRVKVTSTTTEVLTVGYDVRVKSSVEAV